MDLLKQYGLFALAAIAVVVGIVLAVVGPSEYAIMGYTVGALLAAAGVVVVNPRWGILASSTLAAGAGAYLLWLKVRPTGGPAICTVNATIDCESINNSAYSVIMGGTAFETPISLVGAAFFVGLGVATLAAPKNAPRLFQVAGLFSLFTVAVSLYLASILFTETKFCIFCVSMYVANLLILWAAFRGLAGTDEGLFTGLGPLLSSRSMMTVSGVFVGLLVVGKVALGGQDSGGLPDVDANDDEAVLAVDLTRFYAPVQGELVLDGTEPRDGAKEPTYTIVEFADYACPHCADAGEALHRWIPSQPDVQLMFKVFPLTKECNPAIPQEAESNFPPRCIPALYAECAMRQGRFWDVNRDIFTNQNALARSSFNPDDMDILVRNRGVDVGQLRMCLDETETRRGVGMDAVAGARAGVEGTPAFFVKGVTDDGGWVVLKGPPESMFGLITTHRRQVALRAPADPTPADAAPADAPSTPDEGAPAEGAPTETEGAANEGADAAVHGG